MIRRLVMIGLVIAAEGVAQAAQAETDIVVKAKVSLIDGSQFLGSPRFALVTLALDYGKLEIPLSHVASLSFTKDVAKVGFYNKDVLSGRLEGVPLAFDTAFGEVSLTHTQIKSVTFSKQRDIARHVGEPGLLLYAPLDTEQSSLEAFGARMESTKARIVEGPFGNAMLFDSPDARLTIHLPFSPHTMSEGTIAF
ncbi:MAG: hypothetical protein FWG50_11735, partial [Kiritimatiellaeota bacterium]|nr:hypothetical protein [Kiritimatiellota bacterium]